MPLQLAQAQLISEAFLQAQYAGYALVTQDIAQVVYEQDTSAIQSIKVMQDIAQVVYEQDRRFRESR